MQGLLLFIFAVELPKALFLQLPSRSLLFQLIDVLLHLNFLLLSLLVLQELLMGELLLQLLVLPLHNFVPSAMHLFLEELIILLQLFYILIGFLGALAVHREVFVVAEWVVFQYELVD